MFNTAEDYSGEMLAECNGKGSSGRMSTAVKTKKKKLQKFKYKLGWISFLLPSRDIVK